MAQRSLLLWVLLCSNLVDTLSEVFSYQSRRQHGLLFALVVELVELRLATPLMIKSIFIRDRCIHLNPGAGHRLLLVASVFGEFCARFI